MSSENIKTKSITVGKPFVDFVNAMFNKYIEKIPQYGESWRTCDIDFLYKRLKNEYKEFEAAVALKDQIKELVDISNLSWMIWSRLADKLTVRDPLIVGDVK